MNNLNLAQSEASKRARSFVLPELSGFFIFLRDSQLGNCHWDIYYDIRKVLLRSNMRMKSKEQFLQGKVKQNDAENNTLRWNYAAFKNRTVRHSHTNVVFLHVVGISQVETAFGSLNFTETAARQWADMGTARFFWF